MPLVTSPNTAMSITVPMVVLPAPCLAGGRAAAGTPSVALESLGRPRRRLVLAERKLLRPDCDLLPASPLPVRHRDVVRSGDRLVALVEPDAPDDALVIGLLQGLHHLVGVDLAARGVDRVLEQVDGVVRTGPRLERGT